MFSLAHKDQVCQVRLACERDVPAVRTLLNLAYQELAEQGLNYTASYQSEPETLKQILSTRVFLFFKSDELIATVSLRDENWITNKKSAYVGKFGILPESKKQGLGSTMMAFLEKLAQRDGYEAMQLDTAKPAKHLVDWYQKLGYQIIGEAQFEGKTYDSWIFEKPI